MPRRALPASSPPHLCRRCCFKWHRKLLATSSCRSPPARRLPPPLWAPPSASTASTSCRFHQGIQRAHQERRGPDHPRGHHRLRGPLLHLRHQDPSRRRPHQEGLRHRVRLRRAQQDQGGQDHLSKADLQKIAETKMPDLNAASMEAAMSMIAGTCRSSMGVRGGRRNGRRRK